MTLRSVRYRAIGTSPTAPVASPKRVNTGYRLPLPSGRQRMPVELSGYRVAETRVLLRLAEAGGS
jgi:hypothetical protein